MNYTITYTDTPGDAGRVSTTDIDNAESFTEDSYDSLVGSMVFHTSWLSTLPGYGIFVQDIASSGVLGSAHPDCFELDAPMFMTRTALAGKTLSIEAIAYISEAHSVNGFLKQLLAARGRFLENTFQDLTICNYTQEFDASGAGRL